MKQLRRGNLTFVDRLSEPSESPAGSGWEGCGRVSDFRIEPGLPTEGWEDAARKVFGNLAVILHTRTQTELKLITLNTRLKYLEGALEEVKSRAAVVVPIQSLAPEPLELLKPIQTLLQQSGEDYVATFLDANINASGETQEEALTNLKDVIAGSFEVLESMPDKLGPGPRRQLAVLKQFVKRSQ